MMTHNQLLSWTFLLVVSGPLLLAHPITDSAEMPYSGPVSVEDRGVGNLDDLSLTEQDGPGLRYSSLVPGELNSVRSAGLLPRQMKREMMLEKQSLLNPFGRFLGIRKQFRKRGGNASECFWKYCV